MQVKREAKISILASVGIHLGILLVSGNIQMIGKMDLNNEQDRLFFVKTVKSKELKKDSFHQSDLQGGVETLKFEAPGLFDAEGGPKTEAILLAKETSSTDMVTDEMLAKKKMKDTTDLVKEKEKQTKFLKEKKKRQTRKDIIEVTMEDSFEEFEDQLEEVEISDDFIDRMPGFTPGLQAEAPRSVGESFGSGGIKGKGSVVKRALSSDVIDKLFGGDVLVYEDPDDGMKYFQLKINVAKADELLPVLPKEVVFLIDCSISIKQDRLEEFKNGVKHSLINLNSQDYFNIIAFKERTEKFTAKSVQPTEENIEKALTFIGGLTAGEKTDTYNALYKTIKMKSVVEPSYIVLLSDGRPTKGITDAQKLINKIAKENKGKTPIFAFSGGSWVNRYLLDFISYKNRGWAEYSYRSHRIDQNLGAMYDKIRNPVLLNLRYYASGINKKEMFPQNLPDLYQNVEFTLYGIFDEEDKFAIQLNGSVDGKMKTYTMVRSLKNAQKGNKEIARAWAFNKIYHLIGKLKAGRENLKLIDEINVLSKKYGIKTPYQKKYWKRN